ncbi:hypothetical protein V8E55_008970, partial [Tylopilus felleus]
MHFFFISFPLSANLNRIPEWIAPGKFDYLFASHQIFHVCVVMAALIHSSWFCVPF